VEEVAGLATRLDQDLGPDNIQSLPWAVSAECREKYTPMRLDIVSVHRRRPGEHGVTSGNFFNLRTYNSCLVVAVILLDRSAR
jgi:hypothetical protein